MNREGVETNVMPWVAAGGAPGRAAVSFYGTPTDGDPDSGTFKATWNVYVSQVLDAFAPSPAVDQVAATSHPNHYDSICLGGLGCDVAMGDRSLVDYFTMAYDDRTGKLVIVYNQAAKKPGDAEGVIAAPVVVQQTAGPSNKGGTLSGPPALASGRADVPGDAFGRWTVRDGLLGSPTTELPGAESVPALDLLDVQVGPQVDLETGAPVDGGGLTVTMTYEDLSDAALQAALTDTQATSLVYLFRFFDGYQPGGAAAFYEPVTGGWRFGYDDYTTSARNPQGNVQTYKGSTRDPGRRRRRRPARSGCPSRPTWSRRSRAVPVRARRRPRSRRRPGDAGLRRRGLDVQLPAADQPGRAVVPDAGRQHRQLRLPHQLGVRDPAGRDPAGHGRWRRDPAAGLARRRPAAGDRRARPAAGGAGARRRRGGRPHGAPPGLSPHVVRARPASCGAGAVVCGRPRRGSGTRMEHFEIAAVAEQSADFRRVLWTGEHTQLVIMTIPPGGEIGVETHDENDQILSFVSGIGKAVIGKQEKAVKAGDVVVVPAGKEHNFTNEGPNPLVLYTVYGPPDHADGAVHGTKEEADALEEAGKDEPPQG